MKTQRQTTRSYTMLQDYIAKTIEPQFNFKKNGIYTTCNALSGLCDDYNGYNVSVVKEDGGWIVFADEHSQKDLSDHYDTPLFFKTKKGALKLALEFAQDFYRCYFENIYEND